MSTFDDDISFRFVQKFIIVENYVNAKRIIFSDNS